MLAGTVAAVGWSLPAELARWEMSVTGLAQEWRGPRRPQAPVTIVAVDDFSLQQIAQADLSRDPLVRTIKDWPWPREVYAAVLDRVYAAGARAVAFDLLFDTASSHGPADDASLSHALQRHGDTSVLAAMVLESKGEVGGLALTLPLPRLRQAHPLLATGLLNGPLEVDGTIRRRPSDYAREVRRELGDAVPPGLAVSLLQRGGGQDRSQPPALPGSWLPLLNQYGPPRSIPTVSIWQLLEPGSYSALRSSGRLRGQFVLIGPTAALFQDLHRTPFSGGEGTAGVELHATELANRIEGRSLWLLEADRWWGPILGVTVLAAGLLAKRWEKPLHRLAVLAGLAAAVGLFSLSLIAHWAIAPGLFSASVVLLLTGIVSSAEATVRLQWQRRRLRLALGRYLSPAVAEEIASQPAEADGLLGGRSTEVVVLITDIRGFTARTRRMSEAGKAQDLVLQLNEYFTEIVAALHGEGATVDKFIGDATLAIFGAPLNRGAPAEAAAALRAALDIRRRLDQLNSRWQHEGKECWQQVIVLNFGPVISGNVGCSSRMDYTVIGDAVNAASRLEGIAKQCQRDLVMSEAFKRLLPEAIDVEVLGRFELRGHGEEAVFGLIDDESSRQTSELAKPATTSSGP